MVKHRLAMAVAMASLAASAAFGYGVEGWPQGKPDHVIQAERDSSGGCGDCCGGKKTTQKVCANAGFSN
ncbi:MAG: hypothetical protein RBU21_11860 [FCB group bacterium]|jgi:hypothetical protein|nr:hypothetical protein [FCB group bacterium]